MYQELSLYPELTVAENIFMGHAPRRGGDRFGVLDWGTMAARARELLASLDIHDLDVHRKVGTLNVGNRQRVEIAKALSINARVLIMDEPTAALTESDVERLFDIVRLLKERGVAIIYISHRLAGGLRAGRPGHGPARRPLRGLEARGRVTEDELIRMMVGRTITELFPKLPSELRDDVLEVRNLTRRPHTQDVSLKVRGGEIVGIAGLVGSGRSETAQIVFGILPARLGRGPARGPARSASARPGQAMRAGHRLRAGGPRHAGPRPGRCGSARTSRWPSCGSLARFGMVDSGQRSGASART